MGTERYVADVVELPAAEAARQREAQAAATRQFAKYQASAAPREIPVFAIERVDPR